MATLLDSTGCELAYYCDACDSREESADLDEYGCCPNCRAQRLADDGEWAAARAVCDAYSLPTPDALGLHELDDEISARQVEDFFYATTSSAQNH